MLRLSGLVLCALSLCAQDEIARLAASGSEAMRAGDYATAERHHRALLKLQPGMTEAEFNLGLCLFLQKKYEEASSTFRHVLKAKPDLVNAWLFAGLSSFHLNRLRDAQESLRKYANVRPTDFQGQYFLGLTYLAREQYAEAQKPLLAARELQPKNIDVLYHLAQSYLGQARKDPAKLAFLKEKYEQTIGEIGALEPGSYRIGQLRAGYAEAAGQKAEAIKELESLLKNDPRVRGLHYTLGCLYMEANQHELSRRELEAELKLDSPTPRTYLQLGHVYLALSKPDDALPMLQKAIAVDPESAASSWVEIGRAYRAMGKPSDAMAAYEKAIAGGQRDSATYYQLGMVAKSAGASKRSQEALEISKRLRNEEKPKNLVSQ